MISDERLREAARKVEESMLASLPEPEECEATFSPKFERKMEKLLHRVEHPIRKRIMKAMACLLLVFLVGGGSVLTFSVEARATFVGWVQEIYESLTLYHFEGERPNSIEDPQYRPSWLPGSYQESSVPDLSGQVNVIYKDSDNSMLLFCYSNDATNVYIGNADAQIHDVIIHGCPGEFYSYDTSNAANCIVWTDRSSGMIFWVLADLDEESMIRLAESVEKVED